MAERDKLTQAVGQQFVDTNNAFENRINVDLRITIDEEILMCIKDPLAGGTERNSDLNLALTRLV